MLGVDTKFPLLNPPSNLNEKFLYKTWNNRWKKHETMFDTYDFFIKHNIEEKANRKLFIERIELSKQILEGSKYIKFYIFRPINKVAINFLIYGIEQNSYEEFEYDLDIKELLNIKSKYRDKYTAYTLRLGNSVYKSYEDIIHNFDKHLLVHIINEIKRKKLYVDSLDNYKWVVAHPNNTTIHHQYIIYDSNLKEDEVFVFNEIEQDLEYKELTPYRPFCAAYTLCASDVHENSWISKYTLSYTTAYTTVIDDSIQYFAQYIPKS